MKSPARSCKKIRPRGKLETGQTTGKHLIKKVLKCFGKCGYGYGEEFHFHFRSLNLIPSEFPFPVLWLRVRRRNGRKVHWGAKPPPAARTFEIGQHLKITKNKSTTCPARVFGIKGTICCNFDILGESWKCTKRAAVKMD